MTQQNPHYRTSTDGEAVPVGETFPKYLRRPRRPYLERLGTVLIGARPTYWLEGSVLAVGSAVVLDNPAAGVGALAGWCIGPALVAWRVP